MTKIYSPPSEFLQAVIREEVSFAGHESGERNLGRLIALTRDADPANRDWATLLLAQLEMDQTNVRDALIAASSDESPVVRSEAILGLAQIDPSVALPLVKRELEGDFVYMPLLEAVIIVADNSLIADLEAFLATSDDEFLDRMVADALLACRAIA